MGSLGSDAKLPWIRTPCLLNPQLSRVAGCNVYLKLENLQPSGSFKSRGIGNLMTQAAAAPQARSTSTAPLAATLVWHVQLLPSLWAKRRLS
ncbi:catabolic L-serine/threonine dehydratase [Fusarium oxysporum]|nr:catabolic L-serine/threonine dehydratase [Fusarium oxysporum]